jgi:hypothetical protein
MGPRVARNRPYLSWALLVNHLYTHLSLLVIFRVIVAAASQGLGHIYGPKASYTAIWDAHMETADSNFGSRLLLYLIIGPLIDAAETVRLFRSPFIGV